eukprot:GHRQ01024696.1.p1 GENE.GHRQ01024696.1~~GHRQ01024696.1.p1  ORF type:complete len:157 (+),score=33.46 GHRQ01024696.1:240-710(+)
MPAWYLVEAYNAVKTAVCNTMYALTIPEPLLLLLAATTQQRLLSQVSIEHKCSAAPQNILIIMIITLPIQRHRHYVTPAAASMQMAAMDVLMKHEFLRIKLGDGCGLERKQTAALLAQLLDSAVVGQVGFTITLYRQKGLPRPDNLTKRSTAAQAA